MRKLEGLTLKSGNTQSTQTNVYLRTLILHTRDGREYIVSTNDFKKTINADLILKTLLEEKGVKLLTKVG